MKRYEIKNRYTGAIIYATEANSLKEAVEKAVKEKISLSVANLRGANLREAYLSVANLSGADLSEADLSGANLSEADLSGAYLREAYLSGAYLREAKGAELAIARTRIIPSEGPFIGWKKCRNNVLIKLLIPTGAKRSHAFGRKCRAEFVIVMEVFGASEGISHYDANTSYKVNSNNIAVYCDKWNEDFTVECGGGIHFFLTRKEAEAYQQ